MNMKHDEYDIIYRKNEIKFKYIQMIFKDEWFGTKTKQNAINVS